MTDPMLTCSADDIDRSGGNAFVNSTPEKSAHNRPATRGRRPTAAANVPSAFCLPTCAAAPPEMRDRHAERREPVDEIRHHNLDFRGPERVEAVVMNVRHHRNVLTGCVAKNLEDALAVFPVTKADVTIREVQLHAALCSCSTHRFTSSRAYSRLGFTLAKGIKRAGAFAASAAVKSLSWRTRRYSSGDGLRAPSADTSVAFTYAVESTKARSTPVLSSSSSTYGASRGLTAAAISASAISACVRATNEGLNT